jgi:hypothetical protein
MGILTLLRNAFGRSRKSRAAEAEGADQLTSQPSTPTLPEPRHAEARDHDHADAGEHDLVTAAFDSVKVPHPAQSPETAEERPETAAGAMPEPATGAEEDREPATAGVSAEPEAEKEAEAEAQAGIQAEAEAETGAEAKEEPEPEAEAEKAEPEAEAEKAEPEAGAGVEAATEATEEAEPEAQQEPEAEAEAGVQAEAEAEKEAGPQAEADIQPAGAETAPKAEDEAEAEPETEAVPAPTPEPHAAQTETAAPEPAEEPVTASADEAAVPAEDPNEPQAAEGEDTPQGTPAADDESHTADAAGSTDTEGEAEAEATPADATAEESKPATPLTKVKSRTPSLATAYKAATTALEKSGLTGARAKVYLVLDRSASMRPYYKDGSAQALADQTLALAAHLDPEATVHVVFFSTEVDGTTDLTLAPDHETKIDDVHAGLGRMGRTSYHAAVEAVLAHYGKHTDGTANPRTPALVVFQTDGAPDAKTPATQALTAAADTHPGVFFSFVAFGEHDNKAFDYLRKLKTANASFFHAGPTPRELTDTELYEGVLAAWRP